MNKAQFIREAATVVLLRDGARGLELYMVQRARKMAFSAGAYVFPGGAVDAGDASPQLAALCSGADDGVLDARLGIAGARRFYVSALREAFEETGYLLARDADGALPEFDAGDEVELDAARARSREDAAGFAGWLSESGLRLDCRALHYYAYWTTPPGESRRFATRFFAAQAPAGQEPLHDGEETVDQIWIRPTDALAEFAARRFKLIFPTIKQLEYFSRFGSVAAAIESIQALTDIPNVKTRLRLNAEGKICGAALPGDPGYEDLPDWD